MINPENSCEYFATKSLLVVGQVPPLVCIWCFIEPWLKKKNLPACYIFIVQVIQQ